MYRHGSRSACGDLIFPKLCAFVKRETSFSAMAEPCRHASAPLRRVQRPEGERMLAIQERLPLVRPRTRSARRPFTPAQGREGYRFPHDVRDRLAADLQPFRNRESAFALAVFLARYWSVPSRVSGPFFVTREVLADHPDHGLTEARVRGAIRTLEAVGFLDRAMREGSPYKRPTFDAQGKPEVRRKPIAYVFGSDYAPAFLAANKRAQAARGGHSRERRPVTPATPPRPSTPLPGARLKSPVKQSEAERTVLNRRANERAPQSAESHPGLEAALGRLLQGIRQSRDGSGEGGAR
jgi:hypothetical protein